MRQDRRVLFAVTRETVITDSILRWLRGAGYYAFKTHGEAMQERGLPDVVACVAGRFVAIEVKVPGEEPTAIQEHHLHQIEDAGGVGIVADSLRAVQDAIAAILDG